MSRYDHTSAPHVHERLNESAELVRLGLLCGWFTVADAACWAGRVVAAASDTLPLLVELAASAGASPEDAALLLEPLTEGADIDTAKRRLVALLHELLMRDADSARSIAAMVVRLADAAGDLDLFAAGCGWKDELALADMGVFGAAEVVREMIAELANHTVPGLPPDGHR